jgi:hypothetical protein
MPTIAVFYGIVVQMYWRDHGPPHLHAFYQGFEALIAIESGEILGGRLPPGALRLLRDWVAQRRALLMENWQRARDRIPLERIPGPDEDE